LHQAEFKKLGGVIRDGFTVTSVVPGEKVTVRGQYNKQDVSLTASKLAICAGPWASKLVDPLLTKSKIYRLGASKARNMLNVFLHLNREATSAGFANSSFLLENQGKWTRRYPKYFHRLRRRRFLGNSRVRVPKYVQGTQKI
jgi:phytoene dehydrogenase-like protein